MIIMLVHNFIAEIVHKFMQMSGVKIISARF